MRALLDEAGLVQHQHGVRITQLLDDVGLQVVADLLGIPAHAAEKVLHPVGRGIAGTLGQLPAILALHRGQQPAQIGQQASARLDPGEAGRKARAQPLQLRRPGGRVLQSRHGNSLHDGSGYHRKLGCSTRACPQSWDQAA
jgi:hypothetical protein